MSRSNVEKFKTPAQEFFDIARLAIVRAEFGFSDDFPPPVLPKEYADVRQAVIAAAHRIPAASVLIELVLDVDQCIAELYEGNLELCYEAESILRRFRLASMIEDTDLAVRENEFDDATIEKARGIYLSNPEMDAASFAKAIKKRKVTALTLLKKFKKE